MSLNSILNAACSAHVAFAANDCHVMAIVGEEAVSV